MQAEVKLPKLTLPCMLEASVNRFRERPALSMAFEEPLSYDDFYKSVVSIAQLLKKNDVMKGDKIAILGENSPNWGIAYFASVLSGAIVVPILPDFSEADVHHVLIDSEAKILFTTQRQMEKVLGLQEQKLQAVITLDDFNAQSDWLPVEPFSKFIEKALNFLRQLPDKIGLKSADIAEDDIASIIYTSGTSGHSKAVMLTHRNFIANVLAADTLIAIRSDWTFLSILPLSHTYEFTLGFLFPLLRGARVVYAGKTPTPSVLEKICRQEKPTLIAAVPLIMEKIYKKKVLVAFEKNFAIKIAAKIPGLKTKIYKKIKNKLLDFFGGELQIMAIGGAAINHDAELFLRKSGFPVPDRLWTHGVGPAAGRRPLGGRNHSGGLNRKTDPRSGDQNHRSRSPKRDRRNSRPRRQHHEGVLQEPGVDPGGDRCPGLAAHRRPGPF